VHHGRAVVLAGEAPLFRCGRRTDHGHPAQTVLIGGAPKAHVTRGFINPEGEVSMLAGARRRSVALSCFCLTILALIFAASHRADAQVLYGSVLGDVKDTTGASVPGANVVITNKGTGLTREAVTDTAGHYN